LVASNDWQCWAALGRFLDQRAAQAVFFGIPRKVSPAHTFFRNPDILRYPPPPEQMERALQSRVEAAACFNQAVRLAPNEADVFLARAFHLCYSNWVAALVRHYRGEAQLTSEKLALSLTVCPGAAADLQRAAELKPKAYKLISWIVWTEWCAAMTEGDGLLTSRPKTLNDLPDQSRQVILKAMRKLKALGEGADQRVAAGALTSVCMIKAMLTKETDLLADLQRAVELDPHNDQAWDLLIGISVDAAVPEKFSEVCLKRLRHQPSARNYLAAAKALYWQKQFKEAATQAQEALKLDRKYAPAVLMLAAVAIRQGDHPDVARTFLVQARRLIDELTDGAERQKRLRELVLNAAIVHGLDGEFAKARELLHQILEYAPQDEDARKILNALP
jgi:tetratricopeptide (TPR) repeat protein